MGTAVEKKQNPGALAVPEEIEAAFAEHAGAGSDDATQADRATPFLGLIQGLSPQIDKTKPQYLKGAEVGDVFNTVTGEVYKNEEGGVRVVPVLFQKVWTVWVPRDLGGGFLGSYADAELSKPVFVPPQGAEHPADAPTQVVETAQHWALVEGKDGTWSPAIIPMKKTQMKASRNWNTQTTIAANKYTTAKGPAPVFACTYRITSVSQQNDKGTFANYKVENLGLTPLPLIKMAAEFRAAIKAGLVRADYAKEAETAGETVDDAPSAPGKPGF